jgi:hypothetical protein
MNREDTKILIPVMQAYADGKDIQYKSGCNTYKDGFAPNWNWHDDTDVYRVKPEPVDNIPATEEELKEMFEDRTFFKNKKDGSVGWKYKIREAEIDLERNFVFDHETKCWKVMSSIPIPIPQVEEKTEMTPKEFEKKHPLYKIVRQGQYYRYFICSNADGLTFIIIDVELKRFHTYKNISSIDMYDDLKLLYNHYRKELELESK